jgi:hypothetical protein
MALSGAFAATSRQQKQEEMKENMAEKRLNEENENGENIVSMAAA